MKTIKMAVNSFDSFMVGKLVTERTYYNKLYKKIKKFQKILPTIYIMN